MACRALLAQAAHERLAAGGRPCRAPWWRHMEHLPLFPGPSSGWEAGQCNGAMEPRTFYRSDVAGRQGGGEVGALGGLAAMHEPVPKPHGPRGVPAAPSPSHCMRRVAAGSDALW